MSLPTIIKYKKVCFFLLFTLPSYISFLGFYLANKRVCNSRVQEESEERRERVAPLVQLDLLAPRVPLEMMVPKEAL